MADTSLIQIKATILNALNNKKFEKAGGATKELRDFLGLDKGYTFSNYFADIEKAKHITGRLKTPKDSKKPIKIWKITKAGKEFLEKINHHIISDPQILIKTIVERNATIMANRTSPPAKSTRVSKRVDQAMASFADVLKENEQHVIFLNRLEQLITEHKARFEDHQTEEAI